MKKWLSRLLLVILVFSLNLSNTNVTAKAAEKTQNVQYEEKVQNVQEEKTKELTQEEIIEKNTESGISANYNILHADQVKASKNSNGRLSSPDIANASENSLTNKKINMIVMLIDFPTSDSDPNKGKVTVNKTYSDAQIATLNSAFYGSTRSLTNYISTVSRGNSSVNPVLTYKNNSEGKVYVYTAKHPLGYYLPYSSSNPIGYKNGYYFDRTELFSNAFAALKKYIPSNLDLDVDDNGYIDSIDFFTPYCGAWNDFLWSHSWVVQDGSQSANGAKLNGYNQITFPTNNTNVYKTITHEYMHTIGFPDQYTYSDETFTSPFDSWTPMTYGTTGYPTVWERYRYGYNWVSESGIKEITKDGPYTLKGSTTDSSSNTIAYKIDIPDSDEFFMIEYRDRNANIYESDMYNSGIIVYRVNPNRIGNASGDPELYQLRNAGQSCNNAYLNGTSGHTSLELKDYDGNYLGTVECTGISNGQAYFKVEQNIKIKEINVKGSSNYYKVYNNQTIVGNKLVLSGTTEYSEDPIQYVYTVKDSSGVTTTLTNYDSTNAYWQPTKTGKYTITLTVTDKTGNKASKSISFTVVDRISVLSASLDKSSPQVVGTKITAKVNVTGGIGNKKCIAMKAQGGNYQFGSKDVYFTMTGDFTGYWTPDTDGEYKLYATVQDESGFTTLLSIGTYVIEKNQVTVYYNGYSSPYIHYQVGSGSWTSAPGVKMETSSDIDGYTHVASIDLGSASKLTACFNDGNGSWDSNGGNNYSFNAGYYTFKNGVITKIDKPTKKLGITSLTTNYSKGVTGFRPVTISTGIKDAQGTVKYTYTDIAADGTTKVIKSNTTDSTVSWLPSSYGKHNIKVTATDGVTTVTKTIDFSVNMYATVTISGPSETSVGKATTFTMNATGGTGNLTYKFYYTKSFSYNKVLIQSSNSNTLTWRPSEAGTYQLWYSISDEGGDENHEFGYKQVTVEEKVEAKTVIYYKGYSTPYIHYKIGNGSWTNAPGVKMESSSDVDGYTHMIEIDLDDADNITACFNDGNGSWDSNGGNNYTFGEGYYTFANGTINKIEKPSSELRIKSITCDKGDTIKYGDKAKFTINAAGGSGVYTYSMTTSAYGSGRTLNLLSNSTSNTASWTPDYPRVIYITATVTDSTGKSVTYTEHFTVKEVTSNEITIYYKGYDNPYIHYKIGNGSWTNAPGIAMTKTSEKSGYTHKITIDLGDADNITACFNNGNGSWDSNNGNNYYFNGVGTYTYSNGSVNKIS